MKTAFKSLSNYIQALSRLICLPCGIERGCEREREREGEREREKERDRGRERERTRKRGGGREFHRDFTSTSGTQSVIFKPSYSHIDNNSIYCSHKLT